MGISLTSFHRALFRTAVWGGPGSGAAGVRGAQSTERGCAGGREWLEGGDPTGHGVTARLLASSLGGGRMAYSSKVRFPAMVVSR